jgi:hypothetical protein
MVMSPRASIVKISPFPPLYVICSSSAGEFWFSPTVVHVPTRQGSTAAVALAPADVVAAGDDVALGDVGEDPPHAPSAMAVKAMIPIQLHVALADRA